MVKKDFTLKYYGSKFAVCATMNNSSDFSILTHVSIVLYWKMPSVFQALIGIKNKHGNTISLSCDANSIPNSLSNVEENATACQSSDAFFCWDSMQWIWKCHV